MLRISKRPSVTVRRLAYDLALLWVFFLVGISIIRGVLMVARYFSVSY